MQPEDMEAAAAGGDAVMRDAENDAGAANGAPRCASHGCCWFVCLHMARWWPAGILPACAAAALLTLRTCWGLRLCNRSARAQADKPAEGAEGAEVKGKAKTKISAEKFRTMKVCAWNLGSCHVARWDVAVIQPPHTNPGHVALVLVIMQPSSRSYVPAPALSHPHRTCW